MKKLLALVLVLCMVVSLLAVAHAESAVYRFEKPLTLKVSVFDRGTPGNSPANDNYYTRWIQENFGDPRNITIEWVVIPRSEEEAKLATLITSSDTAPDICFTYNSSIVSNYVQQGGVREITDLVDAYGPTLKTFLGEEVLNAGRFDGGMYALPARRVVIADQGNFIREDWLEKLGMKMPTTKEEFVECLRAFRDKNPGEVPGGCIPYAMNDDLRNQNNMMFSFIKNLDERTLATTPRVLWDGYEDFLVWMNMLYNEGLISPDFATDSSSEQLNQAITSGQAGGYSANYDHPIRITPGLLANLQAQVPGAKLSPLKCFESANDPTKYYHLVYNRDGLLNFIPVWSDDDHAKAAIMYLDWLCQYDTIFNLQNGVEGITYNLNEDGIPVLIAGVEGDMKFNSMQNLDYTLLVNGQWLDTEEKTMKSQALSYQGYADLYAPMYEIGNMDPVATGFHFEKIITSSAQYGTTLNDYLKEILVKCTMCKPEEVHELYTSMAQEYMNRGGQAVMDEQVAAWDEAHPAQ
ncbi:MAG: extracellular solute-binding protein [Clostridia bacterium]|nr:extracellular solute-binding protein [Clostridia bacterium]